MTIESNWFKEIFKDKQCLGMEIKELLYHQQSKYQDILIFENDHYGTVMVLDGAYMLSDIDEHMYHKALTSYGMQNSKTKNDLKILVIGAGDGGIVRDLLRHHGEHIKQIDMVEIDEDVINVSKKFFPEISSEFSNPKLNLIVDDALKFIKSSSDHEYDLVLCDSTDPVGFAAGLIEEDFYNDVKRIMTENGIFCAQSGSPFFQKEELEKARTNLKKVFNDVHTFYAPMLVYPGSLWSYTAAGKEISNKNNLDIKEFVK